MTEQSPYAGTTTPPPTAGTRTDHGLAARSSQAMPGGLLAVGTRVTVRVGDDVYYTGRIIDMASVPAPYIALADVDATWTDTMIVFTGPGVIIAEAPPAHPALG